MKKLKYTFSHLKTAITQTIIDVANCKTRHRNSKAGGPFSKKLWVNDNWNFLVLVIHIALCFNVCVLLHIQYIILDVGMIKRNVIASTKPDMIIEIDGDNYTVTTITSLKTIKISFTLGKEYEADPGTDKKSTVMDSKFVIL